MSDTQTVQLIVYALPDKRRWIICEHSPLVYGGGEFHLRADLSSYAVPSQCPPKPGLHLVEATFTPSPERFGGCRLSVTRIVQLAGGMERLKSGAEEVV